MSNPLLDAAQTNKPPPGDEPKLPPLAGAWADLGDPYGNKALTTDQTTDGDDDTGVLF